MDEIYYIYVIRSEVDHRLYVGMSRNPSKRLLGHNKGETSSTKAYRPWKLVYVEKVGSRLNARKREKQLKTGQGREYIKKIIPG